VSTAERADKSAAGEAGQHEGGEAIRCEYCDRRFAEDDLLALHRGLSHPERLGENEREAFEAAYVGEEEGLRLFRLKALLALMALYFMLLFAYSIFG
jgi:hypothetical protein